jgi:hypothetical protein
MSSLAGIPEEEVTVESAGILAESSVGGALDGDRVVKTWRGLADIVDGRFIKPTKEGLGSP